MIALYNLHHLNVFKIFLFLSINKNHSFDHKNLYISSDDGIFSSLFVNKGFYIIFDDIPPFPLLSQHPIMQYLSLLSFIFILFHDKFLYILLEHSFDATLQIQ